MSLFTKVLSLLKNKKESELKQPISIDNLTEEKKDLEESLPVYQEHVDLPKVDVQQIEEVQQEDINLIEEVQEELTDELSEEEIYAKIKEGFAESARTKKPVTLEFTITKPIAKKLVRDFPEYKKNLPVQWVEDFDKEEQLEKEKLGNDLLFELKEKERQIKALNSVLSPSIPEKQKYDFVAIDFETANSSRTSACSVAIVAVKDKKILFEKQWLIKPAPFYVASANEAVHGIGIDALKYAASFPEVWEELERFVSNQTLVAHNMSFDKSVLNAVLEHHQIEIPYFEEQCTMQLSRKVWKFLDDHKLPTVAKYAGFQNLNHHDALSDAKACARIYWELLADNTPISFEKYVNPKPVKSDVIQKPKKPSLSTPQIPHNLDTNHPLYAKRVVVTGELMSMSREGTKEALQRVGAKSVSSVSKITDYLVVGDHTRNFGPGFVSNKEEIASAFGIRIINENEFLQLLGGNSI